MPRPCERLCPEDKGGCGQWKHYNRFHSWRRSNRSVATFAVLCRDCEQRIRNERKNEDRPLWIIKQRAKAYATKYGVVFDFLWINMNWRALVPMFRAMCSPEGLCLSCGHGFTSEPDIQLEHVEAPRHSKDFARIHARNIALRCGSCNRGKSDTPYTEWLDQEESKRLSNETKPYSVLPIEVERVQANLFNALPIQRKP